MFAICVQAKRALLPAEPDVLRPARLEHQLVTALDADRWFAVSLFVKARGGSALVPAELELLAAVEERLRATYPALDFSGLPEAVIAELIDLFLLTEWLVAAVRGHLGLHALLDTTQPEPQQEPQLSLLSPLPADLPAEPAEESADVQFIKEEFVTQPRLRIKRKTAPLRADPKPQRPRTTPPAEPPASQPQKPPVEPPVEQPVEPAAEGPQNMLELLAAESGLEPTEGQMAGGELPACSLAAIPSLLHLFRNYYDAVRRARETGRPLL